VSPRITLNLFVCASYNEATASIDVEICVRKRINVVIRSIPHYLGLSNL
jgi:hypothetical protein